MNYIKIVAEYVLNNKRRLNRILWTNTGKTIEEIEVDTDRHNFMNAGEAMEYGLIDKVMNDRK